MSILYVIAAMLGIVVAAIVLRAWVLTVLWAWFAVPYGAPEIGIPTAIGISLIVGMFTHNVSKDKTIKIKTMSDFTAEVMGRAFGNPLAVLFIGWVVTWFM